jgi:SAM-dependent methyltransferase
LQLTPSDRALELGCGTGYMITLPLRTWGYDVVGIDLDEPSIRYGRDLLRRNGLNPGALRVAELDQLDESFDVVLASEVLEHLTDHELESTLSTIRARLRPGGRLLVTVPNGYGWFELEAALWFRTGFDRLFNRRWPNRLICRIQSLLARGYIDAEHPSTLADSPHRQRFTYRSIQRHLREAGFEVVAARGSVLIAGPFSHVALTGFGIVRRINAALGRRLSPIAAGFYVSARLPR